MNLEYAFIPVDKPRGPPSAQVTSWVKDLLGAKKAGHIGTLDPNVSGVLLVAINKGVRLSRYLSGQDKTYVAVMQLHKDVEDRKILEAAKRFTGEIEQTPPLRSAVAKRKRRRKVYYIRILEREGRLVLFETKVEGGTYIRKLIHDMGRWMGCGANMLELRRIRSGLVGEERIYSLQDVRFAVEMAKRGDDSFLEKVILRPWEVIDLPRVIIKDTAALNLAKGAPLYRKGLVEDAEGERALVFTESGQFGGVMRIVNKGDIYGRMEVNLFTEDIKD